MGRQAGAGLAELLEDDLDTDLVQTPVAVVQKADRPGELRALGILTRVVVPAVFDEFPHGRKSITRHHPGRSNPDARAFSRSCIQDS